jgi:hypothetical protein
MKKIVKLTAIIVLIGLLNVSCGGGSIAGIEVSELRNKGLTEDQIKELKVEYEKLSKEFKAMAKAYGGEATKEFIDSKLKSDFEDSVDEFVKINASKPKDSKSTSSAKSDNRNLGIYTYKSLLEAGMYQVQIDELQGMYDKLYRETKLNYEREGIDASSDLIHDDLKKSLDVSIQQYLYNNQRKHLAKKFLKEGTGLISPELFQKHIAPKIEDLTKAFKEMSNSDHSQLFYSLICNAERLISMDLIEVIDSNNLYGFGIGEIEETESSKYTSDGEWYAYATIKDFVVEYWKYRDKCLFNDLNDTQKAYVRNYSSDVPCAIFTNIKSLDKPYLMLDFKFK